MPPLPYFLCALTRGDLPFSLSFAKQNTCSSGHSSTMPVNQYPILELPVSSDQGQSLGSLLAARNRPDALVDWHCSGCNQRMSGTTADLIVGLPPSLFIQFKRFKHRGYGQLSFTVKIPPPVSFESILDMGPYVTLTPKQVEAALKAGGRPRKDSHGAELAGTVKVLYILRGFISHHGSTACSGHYTCTVRAVTKGELCGNEPILAPGSEQFFVLNDASPPSAPKEASRVEKGNAYILAYDAMDLPVVAAIANSAVYTPPSPNPPKKKPLPKPPRIPVPSFPAPSQPKPMPSRSPPIPGLPAAEACAKVMGPLTALQEEAVKFVLNGVTSDPYLQSVRNVASMQLSSQLRVGDLRNQLASSKWLTSDVINSYLALLAERGKKALASAIAAGEANGFKSAAPHGQANGIFLPLQTFFFYPKLMGGKMDFKGYCAKRFNFNAVKDWTNAVSTSSLMDIFFFRWLLIPINVNNANKHWAGVVVDNSELTAAYFDSGLHVDVDYRGGCISTVIQYLSKEWRQRKGDSIPFPDYRATAAPLDLPKQTNDFDCGAFLLATAECFSRGVVPSTEIYSQENMALWRRKLAAALIWGHLL